MQKRILHQALDISREKNNPDSHPRWGLFAHFSFIVQQNKILACGMNRLGPVFQGFGYNQDYGQIHSENDAYRKAKGIINFRKPWDIINVRLNKVHQMRNSTPCSCCFAFLQAMGCRNAWFTTDIAFAKMSLV